MNIGKLLKEERIELDLTQKQMSADIISAAQYSKIEKGDQQIKVVDLIDILSIHNINIENFFEKILYNYQMDNSNDVEKEVLLNSNLRCAFYECNASKAKNILEKSKLMNDSEDLITRARIIFCLLKNKSSDLSDNIKNKIYLYFFSSENWTRDRVALRLFSSSIHLMEFDEAAFFMKDVLSEYYNICDFRLKDQICVATICCIFLNHCNISQKDDVIENSLKLLNNLPPLPELFMFKMLGNYYKAKFENDKDLVQKIRSIMKLSGYDKLTDQFLL